MKKIALTGSNGKGKFALIDDENYDIVNLFKWHITADGYARHMAILPDGSHFNLMLHRLINNTPEGKITDHINHNNLDNRKENLRICTVKQNGMNRKVQRGTSRFKGVCWDKVDEFWRARIQVDGKKKSLGYFKNEKDAAFAYNIAASRYFGKYANFNNIYKEV